ncbi:hypothetical protein, partial [Marilutibacter maris]|uniref:hypothetical protein n=1 Tax=Marilutibacter maris TaxID=1605891 RepID=UPI001B864192
ATLELNYQPKSYLCFSVEFAPDNALQQVVATESEDGELYFESTSQERYYWIDQFRTPHAQRAVERFSSDLSRVGLTESEWLRRLEKR